MNIETGEIYENEDCLSRDEFFKQLKEDRNIDIENLVAIDKNDMTAKQEKEKRVSLKDHKSKLGIKLTKNRKKALRRKGLLK